MPNFFKKISRGANSFFKKADRGANHFFKKEVVGGLDKASSVIGSTAKTVANGIEKGGKYLEKTGALTDILAGAGVVAAPFSGGASLALEGAAAANQFGQDVRKKATRTQSLINASKGKYTAAIARADAPSMSVH